VLWVNVRVVTARPTDEAIGQRVRERREQLRLSQAHIAMKMNLKGHQWHQTTVAKTETGERPLRLTEALALAEALFVQLSVFLGQAPIDPDRASAIGELRRLVEHIEARVAELEG
jgi:transcriptional regulator with XRE-family HTH domain